MSTAICSTHNNPLFVCQCYTPSIAALPTKTYEVLKKWDKALFIRLEHQGKRYEGTVYEVWEDE